MKLHIMLFSICLLISNSIYSASTSNEQNTGAVSGLRYDKIMAYAIKVNNVGLVKKLISDHNIDVNMLYKTDSSIMRPFLIHAVCSRNVKIVDLLLQHPNIDVNIQDENGETALMHSVWLNITEIVKLLLKHPAININLQNINGSTALISSVQDGEKEIVELLLQCSEIDLNLQNNEGKTALMFATLREHKEIVKLLEDYDMNTRSSLKTFSIEELDNNTKVIEYQNQDINVDKIESIVNILLDLNLPSSMMYCLFFGFSDNIDMSKLLDEYGRTCIHRALNNEQYEYVNALWDIYYKEHLYELTIKSKNGKNFMDDFSDQFVKSKYQWNISLIIHILSNDANLPKAMVYAITTNNIDLVKRLIFEYGVDVNMYGNDFEILSKIPGSFKEFIIKCTPLMLATILDRIEIVKVLLQHPAINVNMRNPRGYTALILSSIYDRKEIVSLLLERFDINVNTYNNIGHTAIELAEIFLNLEIVELLEKYNARDGNVLKTISGNEFIDLFINNSLKELNCALKNIKLSDDQQFNLIKLISSSNKEEDPILVIAARNGYTEIVKLMLSFEYVEQNKFTKAASEALIWAAIEDYPEIARLLLQLTDIDINMQGVNGWTALTWAENCHHKEIIKLFKTIKNAKIEEYQGPNIDVDKYDIYGNIALTKESNNKHKKMIELFKHAEIK